MKIVTWEETIEYEEGKEEEIIEGLPSNAKVISKEKGCITIQTELRLVAEDIELLLKKYYPNAVKMGYKVCEEGELS